MRFPVSAVLALVLSVSLAPPVLAQTPTDPLTQIAPDEIPGDFAAAIAEAAEARAQFFAGDHAAALTVLRPMADAGNPVAQNIVGVALTDLNGAYGPYDSGAGFAYLQAAAEQGFAPAMHNLAIAHGEVHDGSGPNLEEAFRWFLTAAELGYEYAFYDTGFALVNGDGVATDVAAGRVWIERALDGRDRALALELLGDLAYYGEGEPVDYARALGLYLEAAEAGSAQAAFYAAAQHYWGEGTPEDDAAAIPLLEQAIAGQIPEAYGYLAYLLQGDVGDIPADLARALSLATEGDALGDGYAAYVLGDMYRWGIGVEVDLDLARAAYARSDARGNVNGLVELGEMAYQGLGEPVNHARALEIFLQAHEIAPTYAHTLYSIGYMQMRGEGTEVDLASATAFLEQAMAQRHWLSMLEGIELYGAPSYTGPQSDPVRARAHCLYMYANDWRPAEEAEQIAHAATCDRLEAELSAEDATRAAEMAAAF